MHIMEVFRKRAQPKEEGPFSVGRGFPLPFGATVTPNGINFSLFSGFATKVNLLLFHPGEEKPFWEIELDSRYNKTGDVWHIQVFELSSDVCYGYRVDGPYQPDEGHRYDKNSILIDPYAHGLSDGKTWGDPMYKGEGLDRSFNRLSTIVSEEFDWQGDLPLSIPMEESIIYEMHVRGFTRDSSSKCRYPGTFRGIIEKIPYLRSIGITAIELMPVFEFDEGENSRVNPMTGERLKNYWGYSTLSFFAVKASYAANKEKNGHIQEFKEMVRELHKAGIEVILDVVFNHTAEGNEEGPTISFKGLDNATYYILGPGGVYMNFSGCGNTVNCNYPFIRDFIIDSLRYWVTEMHVDGFRFDLASILGRGKNGEVLVDPPVIERIAKDPILAHTKIIAEAWDAAGLYQVGNFPACGRWAEWNGRFRDVVRSFVKGEEGQIWDLAQSIMGSPDFYQKTGRYPYHSINYVTCHDGFTLHDLVSYNQKYNVANGEDGNDGCNNNRSWNGGIEGPTIHEETHNIRSQQMRNCLTILFLSQGVPMLLAGDEFARTQQGNNNPYCQDNEISWVNWKSLKKNKNIQRFVKRLIAFRKNHPALHRRHFFEQRDGEYLGISWHGTEAGKPDWGYHSHTLAFLLEGKYAEGKDCDIYVALNAYWRPLEFELPKPPSGKNWHRVIDTGQKAPRDILSEKMAPRVKDKNYWLNPRSSVVLISK